MEKVERDGAPDLTTLTHSGLSLLASCALWSTRRGHTRTHIYLSTHAGDEDILGLYERVCAYVCVCVCLDVTAYPCVLERVRTLPKNPTVCVCFPSSLCAFVLTSMNLYAHLCVYTYIYTSAGAVCWCSFPAVFLAQQLERCRILVPGGVSPCSTPSSQPPLTVSTCVSRLPTISDVEHKRSN